MSDRLEELLNAYLDGELTATEQAAVEQRLAESGEFRLLYEELRAVRMGLDGLPQYRLEANFAEQVLQKVTAAQANTLSANTPETLPVVLSSTSHQPRTQNNPAPRSYLYWNLAAWGSAAAAALVLLMAYPVPTQSTSDLTVARREEQKAPKPESQVVNQPQTKQALENANQKRSEIESEGLPSVTNKVATSKIPEPPVAPIIPEEAASDKVAPEIAVPAKVATNQSSVPIPADTLGRVAASMPAISPLPETPTRLIATPPADELLIVHVDVTLDGLQSGKLPQLLLAEAARSGPKQNRVFNKPTAPVESAAPAANATLSGKGDHDLTEPAKPSPRFVRGVTSGDVQVVEVLADVAQMQTAIQQLKAQTAYVLNVQQEPALGHRSDSANKAVAQFDDAHQIESKSDLKFDRSKLTDNKSADLKPAQDRQLDFDGAGFTVPSVSPPIRKIEKSTTAERATKEAEQNGEVSSQSNSAKSGGSAPSELAPGESGRRDSLARGTLKQPDQRRVLFVFRVVTPPSVAAETGASATNGQATPAKLPLSGPPSAAPAATVPSEKAPAATMPAGQK